MAICPLRWRLQLLFSSLPERARHSKSDQLARDRILNLGCYRSNCAPRRRFDSSRNILRCMVHSAFPAHEWLKRDGRRYRAEGLSSQESMSEDSLWRRWAKAGQKLLGSTEEGSDEVIGGYESDRQGKWGPAYK
ncbi:hypothetical protein A0H81_03846 [Grifola frondosa]|uniref:Uncharacterized protein n=1 Tax=Grifola frondosa TaxID=5627 RepID=A0A1C7MJQ6_GRIFR|nr:hypothetical protein A0H81_03846 [Grifola frondosa]